LAQPSHFQKVLTAKMALAGGALMQAYTRTLARHSIHGNQVFFDTAQFPWTSTVEAQWKSIRAELDQVLMQPQLIPEFEQVSPHQRGLAAYGKWKTFFLFAYNQDIRENCMRCPETTRIAKSIPGATTAFFSILGPKVRLHPHRGPFGGVLRYHLALKVPEPRTACQIRVDNTITTWEEGRGLIFDDTFEHEAWNDTADDRVVLFVDFERPLPPALGAINRLLIGAMSRSSLVKDGLRSYEKWRAGIEPAPPEA
jgi:beta-hydroxylase